MIRPGPHDLLRIIDWRNVICVDTPSWAVDSLTAVPWVVVRRAMTWHDSIPVGVRGPRRADRHAMTVSRQDVRRIVTPTELSRADVTFARKEPAFDALRIIAPQLHDRGLRWGPTGSAGFELATGAPCVTKTSDLDLTVYLDSATANMTDLHRLHNIVEKVPTRVDCQIEFSWGAVGLADVVSGSPKVLARCPDGPRLVETAVLAS